MKPMVLPVCFRKFSRCSGTKWKQIHNLSLDAVSEVWGSCSVEKGGKERTSITHIKLAHKYVAFTGHAEFGLG